MSKLRRQLPLEISAMAKAIWQNRFVTNIVETQNGGTCGMRHCQRVEGNIYLLVEHSKQKIKFTEAELLLLSAAAVLHDIGKSELPEVKKIIATGSLRFETDHGLIAQELLRFDKLGQFIFSGYDLLQDWVGEIVAVHDEGIMDHIPKEATTVHLPPDESVSSVRPRLLAAVFRLADMLDCTCNRPPIMGRISDTPARKTDIGRLGIKSWKIHKLRQECICFNIDRTDEKKYRAACDEVYNLNSQISDSQIAVLRDPPSLKKVSNLRNALPYRFLINETAYVETQDDVFPLHQDLIGIKETLRYYFNEARQTTQQKKITLAKYEIRVTADVANNRAIVSYDLSGRYEGRKPARSITYLVAGDVVAPFEALNCQGRLKLIEGGKSVEHHLADIRCHNEFGPVKVLRFVLPRDLQPGEPFNLAFTYSWPGLVSRYETYWAIDDLYARKGAADLRINVRFSDLTLQHVIGISINTHTLRCEQISQGDIRTGPSDFRWKAGDQEENRIVVFRCITKKK